jgi:3-deoxy-D-manno-octulosonate 8-phosphate phosphatase (KDO 8-P phosphatase)
MPYSHLDDLPADIRERAQRIRLLGLDVDGTLTDGRLYFDPDGRESKAFHVLDGQGLVLLRRTGTIEIALVTARKSKVAEQRAAELGLRCHVGVHDKLVCVEQLCGELGITLDEVCFVGDDLPDLPVLARVGLAVAPANAHPWTRERVHWRTLARGGEGAVREVCDLLLGAQGHAEALLAQALRGTR